MNENYKERMEKEYVFILQLKDPAQLERAYKKCKIEQWQFKSASRAQPNSGVIRARSFDDKKFVLTTKRYVDVSSFKTSIENEIEITKEIFEDIKYLSPSGNIKVRHYFKIDDKLQWEIDIFYNDDGSIFPWCKADLEVVDELKIIPDFPIDALDVIPLERTPKQKEFVKKLYVEKFYIYKSDNIFPLDMNELE